MGEGAILQIWYPYKWKLNLQHSQTKRNKDKIVKLSEVMEKKIAFSFLLVLFLVSSDLDVTVADAFDCLDACYTACVTSNPDPRVRQRCEGKCQIRCGPDSLKDHMERN